MDNLKKSDFLSEADHEKFKICRKLADRFNQKVEDGCLVILKRETVLDGLISFNETGIPGFGIEHGNGRYTHLFGRLHIDTVEDKEGNQRKVKRWIFLAKEEAIKAFFSDCEFVKKSEMTKL